MWGCCGDVVWRGQEYEYEYTISNFSTVDTLTCMVWRDASSVAFRIVDGYCGRASSSPSSHGT